MLLLIPEILAAMLLVAGEEMMHSPHGTLGPHSSVENHRHEHRVTPSLHVHPTSSEVEEVHLRTRILSPKLQPSMPTPTEKVVEPRTSNLVNNARTPASGEMIFGGSSSVIPPPRSQPSSVSFEPDPSPTPLSPARKCNSSEIAYQGRCLILLKQHHCASNEWLVEIDGKPVCQKTSCHYPLIPWKGKCSSLLSLRAISGCPEGMVVTLARDGTAECDCAPGKIYHAATDKCYSAYQQGPCQSGKYFILQDQMRKTEKTGAKIGTCVSNRCGDGKVCYGRNCDFVTNNSKQCVPLDSPCKIKGEPGSIRVSDATNTLGCVPVGYEDPGIRAIGNVPPFPCSPGSRRDATGKCRKTATFSAFE